MLQPNRHGGENYRYGMNGMEQDNEVKGKGNSYTSQFRQYDSRLGRWLSLDPITHAQYSPYSAFDNNPVYYKDASGANSENGDGDPPEGAKNSTDPNGNPITIGDNFFLSPNKLFAMSQNAGNRKWNEDSQSYETYEGDISLEMIVSGSAMEGLVNNLLIYLSGQETLPPVDNIYRLALGGKGEFNTAVGQEYRVGGDAEWVTVGANTYAGYGGMYLLFGDYSNYWYDYTVYGAGPQAGAGYGAEVTLEASISLGMNLTGKSTPETFGGPFLTQGISLEPQAGIGFSLGLSYELSDHWLVFNIDAGVGVGPKLSLIDAPYLGLGNVTVTTPIIKTNDRGAFDKYVLGQVPPLLQPVMFNYIKE